MKRGTTRHPKMHHLADALDIPLSHAAGLMACLWDLTADTKPEGDIGRASNRAIARELSWPEADAERLVNAIASAGFLDPHPTHRWVVHQWSEHCETGVHTFLARAKRRFADGSTPKMSALRSDERESAAKWYAENPFICSQTQVQGVSEEVPRTVQGQSKV